MSSSQGKIMTGGSEMPVVGLGFEQSFMDANLEKKISHCDKYEMVNFFRKWLPEHQPILEAGCGSGRWVGWFIKEGWQATGIDWSEACCARARELIPQARFLAGDLRDMPFADGEFGAIVSLGAVEHSAEGPFRSIKEFYRVLRPGGIAIITVPYFGLVRRMRYIICKPVMLLSHISYVRDLFGKKNGPKSIREAKKETDSRFVADFMMCETGWEFYQYQLTKPQMRRYISATGFEITQEFVEFADEGILHNFGRVAGAYNSDLGKVDLSCVGKCLRRLMPVSVCGHMLCYLVRKPEHA